MPRFRGLSVRRKFFFAFLSTTLLMMAAILSFILILDYRMMKRNLIAGAKSTAIMIGESCGTRLQSRNREALDVILKRASALQQLESINVFDPDGNLFTSYPKQPPFKASLPELLSRLEFREDKLHLVEKATSGNSTVGTVYLIVTFNPLRKQFIQHALVSVLSLSFLGIIFIVISHKLEQEVSAPILKLADAARHISETAAYEIQIKDDTVDEIGTLYAGFNKMLGKIQRREAQRDQAESALRESQQRYQTLVESSPDAIFLQQDGRIVYMNPAGLSLLGYQSDQEVLNKDYDTVFSGQLTANITPQPIEVRMRCQDGKTIDVDVTLIQTAYEGRPAIQGILRNITQHKQLREAAERMKRLAAIGELSAQVSHEIRNTIGSLQLNLRNLSDHIELSDPRYKSIGNMETAIERISKVITGILSFARPTPPSLRRVPVHMVVESSLRIIEKDLEESKVAVIRQYAEPLPCVDVDPDQMSRVFLNLFRNAVQAMPGGGTLTLRTLAEDRFVRVEIADTGEGIPAENLERVFDPFFSTKSDGTGLGLAIAARTIEQHHAQILVESTVGRGTVFTIRIPAVSA